MYTIRTLADAFELAGYAGLIGAVSGLASSLTRPPFGRKKAAFGFDNRFRFPRVFRSAVSKRRWGIDAGSLGPIMVGACAAVFVLFVAGIEATEMPGTGGRPEVVDAASYVELFILAIAGGAAGEVVFRSLAQGSKVPRAALTDAADAAADVAAGHVPPAAQIAVANEVRGAALDVLDQPETAADEAGN